MRRVASSTSPLARPVRARRALAPAVLLTAVALGASATAAVAAPGRHPTPSGPVLHAPVGAPVGVPGPPTGPPPNTSPDQPHMPPRCLSGPSSIISASVARCDVTPHRAGAPTLVLWGDSHAWQQIPAVEAAVAHRRVNLVTFVMGGCPTMDVRVGPHANSCDRLGRLALSYLRHARRHHQRVRLVVAMGWELYRNVVTHPDQAGERYRQARTPWIARNARKGVRGVPRAFDDLGRLGVPTDVVGQTPMVYLDPPACPGGLNPYRCPLPRAGALRSAHANSAYIASLRASLRSPGRLVLPARDICTPTVCPAHVDGLPTYFDDFHIGSRLSTRLGPQLFGPTIRALLHQRR